MPGLADPTDTSRLLSTIELHNQALATSSGSGTLMDAHGVQTHLFDPHTGSAIPRWRSVSVRANDATTADALSTAFSLMQEQQIRSIVVGFPAQAWLLPSGTDQLVKLG
ncbi:FAD:protein FMN transferase [Castellaniella sp.]|uniref:FAD:protein FMN transferase n=1 Tax=Castellaniella sp. TaxID=1955812 RepID=UPI003A598E97